MSYILLVEDNQSHADMTIRILVSAGYEVKHVLRGFDGAQLARKHRPSIILMDFDLPDINGRTMAFILKKQLGATAAPPIIAVTARAGEDEMRMASHFGCAAFVSKPFLPEDLLAVIARFAPPTGQTPPAPPLTSAPTPTSTATAQAISTPAAPSIASIPVAPTPAAASAPTTPSAGTAQPVSTPPPASPISPVTPAPMSTSAAVTKPFVAPPPSPAPTGPNSPTSAGSAPVPPPATDKK